MVDRLLRQDETLEQLRADFMARVQVTTSGCWLWDGDPERYGNFRGELAHRVSWELHQGPIGEGLYILHGCDIAGAARAMYGCVNPTHIRPGTPKENAQDLARARERAQRAKQAREAALAPALAPQEPQKRDVIEEFFSCEHVRIEEKELSKVVEHLGFDFIVWWRQGVCQDCFEDIPIKGGGPRLNKDIAELVVALRILASGEEDEHYNEPFMAFIRRLEIPIPELAKRLGVSLQHLAYVLRRNRYVPDKTMRKLCALFVEVKGAEQPDEIMDELREAIKDLDPEDEETP